MPERDAGSYRLELEEEKQHSASVRNELKRYREMLQERTAQLARVEEAARAEATSAQIHYERREQTEARLARVREWAEKWSAGKPKTPEGQMYQAAAQEVISALDPQPSDESP